MPVFEFRLTCIDEISCKKTQSTMSDFKNKNVKKGKSYDHVALKKFSSWEEAVQKSKDIEKKLGKSLVDLIIAEK